MRKIIFSFFLVISSIANAEIDHSIGTTYERYSVIAEAWFANQKCKFLSNELSTEFERNVALMNVSLSSELDNPTTQLSIQDSAKAIADSEKYSGCPTSARDFVVTALMDSREWSAMIRKTGMKKEVWLKGFKPREIQFLCSNPIIKNTFSGNNQDCSLKLGELFDKCAAQVDNVKIPAALTSRQEAEKYGGIMGECITAYHLGGEYLTLFNQTQAAFDK